MRLLAAIVPGLALALSLASCQPATVPAGARTGLLSLFSGFTYSGESNDERPATARLRVGPLPDRLVSGKTYVFHHLKPYDEGFSFARDIVPGRLLKLGLATTKGFNEGQGPLFFSSGTAWYMRFSGGHCAGTISREVDGFYLKWPWNQTGIEPGMYLLRIAGDCPA